MVWVMKAKGFLLFLKFIDPWIRVRIAILNLGISSILPPKGPKFLPAIYSARIMFRADPIFTVEAAHILRGGNCWVFPQMRSGI